MNTTRSIRTAREEVARRERTEQTMPAAIAPAVLPPRSVLYPIIPILVAWLIALAGLIGRAEIPEPDNVLYGTITLDGVPVTAARTNVVIEARRLINGPAVASYRMGANQQIGNFYSLEVPLESLSPVTAPVASQIGDVLIIVVTDASGVRGQITYTLAERGQVQRVDLGTAIPPPPDSDGDTLPDAWELLRFGNLDRNGASISPNGVTTLDNFISGANPADTNSLFKLRVTLSNDQRRVSFLALRAEGTGYEGRTRFYSLESSTGLTATAWIGVPNFTNLAGNNQTLIYETTSTNSPAFYRGRVWLQGP